MEDKFLIAIVALVGSVMGAIATIGVGWISAAAKDKQAEMQQWQSMLNGGLKAHEMAQEIMGRIHTELEEEVDKLRETVDEHENKIASLERSGEKFARIVADVVDTQELQEIAAKLEEESDVEHINFKL
ncbi:MAG: hypothetical protein U5L04_01615 [Trueperaceae bacterium]|nr:hypothetical protein [Trueperaceae bacterium]